MHSDSTSAQLTVSKEPNNHGPTPCGICHKRSHWDFLGEFYRRVEATSNYAAGLELELQRVRAAEHECNLSLRGCQERLAQMEDIAEENRRHGNVTRDAMQYDCERRALAFQDQMAELHSRYENEQIDNMRAQETIDEQRLQITAARAELETEMEAHIRTKRLFDEAYHNACESMGEADACQERIQELEKSLHATLERSARVTELEILLEEANETGHRLETELEQAKAETASLKDQLRPTKQRKVRASISNGQIRGSARSQRRSNGGIKSELE